MKRTLTALTVAATMFASSASAFDPEDLQKLKDTNECVDCNLKGADLEYADLGETDLRGADLRGADLNGAYLRSANLSGADLGEADLRGAYLGQADFKGADLKDADLRGAYLNGAYLNGANLNGSVLRYAIVKICTVSAVVCLSFRLFSLRWVNLVYSKVLRMVCLPNLYYLIMHAVHSLLTQYGLNRQNQ